MERKSKYDLLKEIESKGVLSVYSYIEYRDNGVIVDSEVAHTGKMFDRLLSLNDDTSIVAKVFNVNKLKK